MNLLEYKNVSNNSPSPLSGEIKESKVATEIKQSTNFTNSEEKALKNLRNIFKTTLTGN